MLFRSERIGEDYSIFNQKWPEVDESKLVLDEVEIPFQINGRLKERFKVSKDATKEDIEEYVRTNFSEYLDGKTIIKFIVVPSRIVNVVLK